MEASTQTPARIFTIPEANALVPGLQLSFAAIAKLCGAVEDGLTRLTEGEPSRIGAILQGELPPPAGEEGGVEAFQESLRDLGKTLEGVAAQGVIIQEVNPGVVDFPSMVDGELVLLCWQVGESSVEHFHPVEASFEERRPLPDAAPLLH